MKPGAPNELNHYFLPQDQALFDYDQIFSISSMWVELGMENVTATYDLLVRDQPPHRNFMLFGGLEEIITKIKCWNFSKNDITFLLDNNIIKPHTARLLKNFHFAGDIWAMPEGTVFFPGEPTMRLTGPIWQINLFTFFLINSLTSNTIFLSKLVRSFLAAGDKIKVLTCPVTRAHSNESAMKFGRAAYILGAPSTIVPSFAKKFNLPTTKVNTKAYHAFIKSFSSELEAMRAAASVFPNIGLMVDTYDFKGGVQNAITVARELKPSGNSISSIVIDSGKNINEYIERVRYTRKALDHAGFQKIKISVMGGFNEEKISVLVKAKAPVDSVVPCTDLVTSSDSPKLEAVLKLAEFKRDGKIFYSAKLTPGKESYPGRKQVFRTYQNGIIVRDVVGLENEILGTPLLIKMVSRGKRVYQLPTLDEIKRYTARQIAMLPERLKNVNKDVSYPVNISHQLKKLFKASIKKHMPKSSLLWKRMS